MRGSILNNMTIHRNHKSVGQFKRDALMLSLDDTPRGSDPPQDSSGVTIVNPKMVVMMIRGPTGAMTPPDTPLKDDEDMDTAPRAYGDAANGARDTSRPYPPTKKKTRDGDA
jgi:hypothetical protein